MANKFVETVGGDFEARINQFAEHYKRNVARVGSQAMAQIVYDSAKSIVSISGIPTHYFYGSASKKAEKGQKTQHRYEFHSGDLREAIYQVFSERSSNDNRKVYHVGWNHNTSQGKSVPYGFMVEFGTSRAAAHPFLYPAFNQNKARLLQAACDAMSEQLKAGVR